MPTNQFGNIVQLAGFIVIIASHFGFNFAKEEVEAAIGAILIIVGWITQSISHKRTLGAALGIPRK